MSDPTEDPDVEQLREQIEHTRDDLAHTVEALAYKADVKNRAKDKVEDLKGSTKDKLEDLKGETLRVTSEKPWLAPAIGGAIATVVGAWLLIRRRRS